MATIHLMFGFIGFGKTTVAKEIAKKHSAICLTHDEFMVKLFGRNIPDNEFRNCYEKVDAMLWSLAEKIIKTGTDVIMDYGFWSHKDREKAFQKAKRITENVVFHLVHCDIKTAKQRVLARTKSNPDEIYIDENIFNTLLTQYEPWTEADKYPVVLHNLSNTDYIGKLVALKIDRPKGSKHPKHGFEYPINYGFVPFTKSGDGEELDAYILNVYETLETFVGQCIGLIHRTNDNDDKLIVVPAGQTVTDKFIENSVSFQEQWFTHVLIR